MAKSNELKEEWEQRQLLAGFHALSDPLRLKILNQIHGQELCVCELTEKLGIAQSKLSFHLKTLKDAGIIQARQDGRWVYYRLRSEQLAYLENYLRGFGQNLPPIVGSCCDG